MNNKPAPAKVRSIKQTCGMCPSQWEGWTEDNRQFYIRYRWGGLSLQFGEIGDADEFAAVRGLYTYYGQVGGPYDGDMSDEEMRKRLAEFLEF